MVNELNKILSTCTCMYTKGFDISIASLAKQCFLECKSTCMRMTQLYSCVTLVLFVSDVNDWTIDENDIPDYTSKLNKSRYYKPINVNCHNCDKIGHLSKNCPQPKVYNSVFVS